MALQTARQASELLKQSVLNRVDNAQASKILDELKQILLEFDSLPPLSIETESASIERLLAREVYECAVIYSINVGDKELFHRYLASLRPYYSSYFGPAVSESNLKIYIMGLNLLYLLVENRLAEFHCELELLDEAELNHPAISFCTQLEQHLMVGSYQQVMASAVNPPIEYYSFFLRSLLETVRLNIGECAAASYQKFTIDSARQIFMFSNNEETRAFIEAFHPDWILVDDNVELQGQKVSKSEEVPSLKLVSQTLLYATELERIV